MVIGPLCRAAGHRTPWRIPAPFLLPVGVSISFVSTRSEESGRSAAGSRTQRLSAIGCRPGRPGCSTARSGGGSSGGGADDRVSDPPETAASPSAARSPARAVPCPSGRSASMTHETAWHDAVGHNDLTIWGANAGDDRAAVEHEQQALPLAAAMAPPTAPARAAYAASQRRDRARRL
jgi:hypothetical protein